MTRVTHKVKENQEGEKLGIIIHYHPHLNQTIITIES